MRCADVRQTLRRSVDSEPEEPVLRHVTDCPECAALLARWRSVRSALSAPPDPSLQPDPGFARRVTEALPTAPDALSAAALRMFPVAAALALVLGGWLWLETGASEDELPRRLTTWMLTTQEAP